MLLVYLFFVFSTNWNATPNHEDNLNISPVQQENTQNNESIFQKDKVNNVRNYYRNNFNGLNNIIINDTVNSSNTTRPLDCCFTFNTSTTISNPPLAQQFSIPTTSHFNTFVPENFSIFHFDNNTARIDNILKLQKTYKTPIFINKGQQKNIQSLSPQNINAYSQPQNSIPSFDEIFKLNSVTNNAINFASETNTNINQVNDSFKIGNPEQTHEAYTAKKIDYDREKNHRSANNINLETQSKPHVRNISYNNKINNYDSQVKRLFESRIEISIDKNNKLDILKDICNNETQYYTFKVNINLCNIPLLYIDFILSQFCAIVPNINGKKMKIKDEFKFFSKEKPEFLPFLYFIYKQKNILFTGDKNRNIVMLNTILDNVQLFIWN